jgi:TatD DNase family protein
MSYVKNRQIIDTHCHQQFSQYDSDRDEMIRRALDAGVNMICVGVDLETSRQAIALAEQYEGIWASVGLHPNDNLDEKYDQASYEELVTHPKVVAIGEVGLDYYRTTDVDKRIFQKERFTQQLELARAVDKPLIIHCRDAHEDMLEMFDSGRGVIHSFTGTLEQALLYIERGYYIGLNGIITFTHQYDDVARSIPLEKMLLETDAPYLTPVPYRGKRNEPVYIRETAKIIADIRGISVDEFIVATTNNAKELFSIL